MEKLVSFLSDYSQQSILVIILIMALITIAWVTLTLFKAEDSKEQKSTEIDMEELRKMKQELRSREFEIDRLKGQIQGAVDNPEAGGEAGEAGGGKPSDDLLTKISELEEKLSEYEIIEDDIADLSRFKEENEKLKNQIQELGGTLEEVISEVKTEEVASDNEEASPADAPAESEEETQSTEDTQAAVAEATPESEAATEEQVVAAEANEAEPVEENTEKKEEPTG